MCALGLQGIFVDAHGNVAEGPNMNVACLLVSTAGSGCPSAAPERLSPSGTLGPVVPAMLHGVHSCGESCVVQGDGTLVVPPFESSLAGITVQRMMELLPAVSKGRPACSPDHVSSCWLARCKKHETEPDHSRRDRSGWVLEL
jgi:hypothetical protein